jgi:hypothetical protein
MTTRSVIIGAGASIESSGGVLPIANNFMVDLRKHPILKEQLLTQAMHQSRTR